MSVHDAELQDIYADAQGKLWRCIALCGEPTVVFEEVEGHTPPPSNPLAHAAAQFPPMPMSTPIIKNRISGGVSGLMWNGFKRIWRKEN